MFCTPSAPSSLTAGPFRPAAAPPRADVLQRQHPDADPDAGDGRRHPGAGGPAGRGERSARRLQHTADAGQQRQVSRRPASPLWRAIRWLGGKWRLEPRRRVLAPASSAHLAALRRSQRLTRLWRAAITQSRAQWAEGGGGYSEQCEQNSKRNLFHLCSLVFLGQNLQNWKQFSFFFRGITAFVVVVQLSRQWSANTLQIIASCNYSLTCLWLSYWRCCCCCFSPHRTAAAMGIYFARRWRRTTCCVSESTD